MRMMIPACCVLVAWAGVARAADDQAAVQAHSERYTEAVRSQDRVALTGLLHKDYRGHRLIGPTGGTNCDAPRALTHWTDPEWRFTHLTGVIKSVRVFGDAAIETGTTSGEAGWRNATGWRAGAYGYGQVNYTRVWLRDGKVWRLVHEGY
jgi:hypothetical protein